MDLLKIEGVNITGDITIEQFTARGIRLNGSTILGSLELNDGVILDNFFMLNHAHIKGDLFLDSLRLGTVDDCIAIDKISLEAASLEVDGTAWVSRSVLPVLIMANARIGESLQITGTSSYLFNLVDSEIKGDVVFTDNKTTQPVATAVLMAGASRIRVPPGFDPGRHEGRGRC
ncbi:hypothetical protein PQR39_41440 [Paraburkholderia sediminicola]|uniref:hypothetical protein n=1 Tax=Paraburkholderia sediminicola TaxID=458836 RepID=UPI0038BBCB5F